MSLTTAQRKERLTHGEQQEVADEFGLSKTYVSRAMAGEMTPKTQEAQRLLRRVQVALARKMRVPVDEAFPVRKELARAS